jgi:ribosomal protein S24E
MDLTIDKTVENPYLQRKEVRGTVTFTGATPAQKQIAEALAAKLNSKADAIFVAHVYTVFGAQKATFEAHVYPSKEQLAKVVRLEKKAIDKAAGKAPAEGAKPAEAKPAEAAKPVAKKEEKAAEPKPAEAKKEEPKKAAEAAKPAEAKKEEPKKAEA